MRSCSLAVKIFVHVSIQLLLLNYAIICTWSECESVTPCLRSLMGCGNLWGASLLLPSPGSSRFCFPALGLAWAPALLRWWLG